MAFSAAQNQVAAAIKELNDCPESVKQMFIAALPSAFGSDLHEFQKETSSMMRKSLEKARADAGEALIGTTQRVKEAQTVLETLRADFESTSGAEEAACALLREKTAALEAAQATVKCEETLCEEAESAKAAVAVERQNRESAKAEVESIQNGSFRMLLDGGWDDEGVRDACIDGVCSYLSSQGSADAVLLAALPKAFGRRPAECGTFDKIAIEEALRLISDKVVACGIQLAEGEESFDDVTAEHLGAWSILDLAREKAQAASALHDSADTALQTATVDKKLAHSKVMDQEATLATLLSESTMAEAKVLQLDLALSALAQLKAGVAVEENDKENKENSMAVDDECKDKAMGMDQVQIAITA